MKVFSVDFTVAPLPARVTDGGAELVRLRFKQFFPQFLTADVLRADEHDRPENRLLLLLLLLLLMLMMTAGMMVVEVDLGL